MRKRKFYFIFSLLLLSLTLFFIAEYLNSIYNWKCSEFFLTYSDKISIPTVVVYSNKNKLKQNEMCNFYNDSQGIPNALEKWHKIGNTHLYLYSAYKDKRQTNGIKFIRILALSSGTFNETIFCRIWNHASSSFSGRIVSQELWITSWDLPKPHQYYRPLLLSCPVEEDVNPVAVSVTAETCQEPTNLMWLSENKSKTSKKDFAVCLKPLNFTVDITAKLIEWLELQFLLGASEVSVYVYTLPPRALQVLKYYKKLGKVTIKNTTLPPNENRTDSEQHIWQKRRYEMLIYNDCFYNHIHSHKVVINLDLDEAILPRKQDSWSELFQQVTVKSRNTYQFASMSAANVYFFDSFGAELDNTIPRYFYMLRHLHRSANFTPPGFAMKSFFLTNSTLSVTNHYALQTLHPHIRINTAISKDYVQMHHYRKSCPPKMETDCEENYMKYKIKDPIILKYKDRLISRVNETVKKLKLIF